MEDSTKKTVMIGIIVVCLVLAVVIWRKTSSSGSSGIESIKRGQLIWVKCKNPDCGVEYQIEKRDYYEYLQEHQDPMSMSAPVLVCKECGKESVYRAVKCPECEVVFFYGSVPNDFGDRCPKCGYSQTEENRKKGREERR